MNGFEFQEYKYLDSCFNSVIHLFYEVHFVCELCQCINMQFSFAINYKNGMKAIRHICSESTLVLLSVQTTVKCQHLGG